MQLILKLLCINKGILLCVIPTCKSNGYIMINKQCNKKNIKP